MHAWANWIKNAVTAITRPVQASLHHMGHLTTSFQKRTEASGRVWMDAEGVVHVQNPLNLHGLYPVIVVPPPDSGITVEVNGIVASTGDVVVQQSDQIVIQAPLQDPRSQFTIDVDEFGMRAVLTVTYQPGVKRTLLATEPQSRLVVQADATIIPTVQVAPNDVDQQLDALRIQFGRTPKSTLEAFLARHENGSIVVAEGVMPVTGSVDTYLPLPMEIRTRSYPGGTVDQPGYVAMGEIIGVLLSGEPSRPGTTVWNTVVPPSPPAPADLRIGEGIQVMDHGLHLVAARPGRIRWMAQSVSLIPEYIHSGVLTVHHSPFSYTGDLLIDGHVRGNVTIVVSGSIIVSGDVFDAELVAGADVWILGDVHHTKIFAGGTSPLGGEVSRHLQHLHDILFSLEQAYHQVRTRAPDQVLPAGPVLQWLVRTKFPEFDSLVQWMQRARTRPPYCYNPDLRALVEEAVPILDGNQFAQTTHIEALEVIRERIQHYTESTHTGESAEAHEPQGVHLRRLIRSRVVGRGPVILQEAQSCDITSEEWVEIRDRVVGGHVRAQQHVWAKVIGSEEGTDTRIDVINDDGWIQSKVIYPNAVVRVGHLTQQITTEMTDMIIDSA